MKLSRLTMFALGLVLVASCSTTRMVPEGKYRLSRNIIEFSDKTTELKKSDISPYIRQDQDFFFNPMLYVYNWQSGKGTKMDTILRKVGTPPKVFSEESMNDSRLNIADHLNYIGYYGSKVKTSIDTVKRNVRVHYLVTPGVRYPIDSISFSTPDDNPAFAQEFERDRGNVLVSKGDYLSEQVLENESVRSAAYFNSLGYYDFNKNHLFFEADTLGGKALLKYMIRDYTRNQSATNAHPLNKYHFRDVSISHSPEVSLRPIVLKRMNTILPGALYNPETVNNTYNRLSSMRLFNGVSIDLNPVDSTELDCNIRLSESSISGIKTDLELSVSSAGMLGITPQVSWYHKNIFHGGEWFNIGTKCNFQLMPKTGKRSTEASINASLSFPRFLGLNSALFKGPELPRTEISASFSYQDRPEYKRSLISLSYGYIGSVKNRFFYQAYPLRGNHTRVFNISNDFHDYIIKNPYLLDMFTEHVDLGVGGMLTYTTNPDIVPKTSYSFAKLSLDLSGNLLKLLGVNHIFGVRTSRYVKGELNIGQAFRFGREDGQAIACRLTAGIGKDFDGYGLPYERQFFVGGASSLRGWQARSIGPGFCKPYDFFLIPSQTGSMKLELDLEYRFRIFKVIEGALFAETGNVWEIDQITYTDEVLFSKDFYKSLAADWGIGLRVNLNFILLRLDLGIKLHDPSKDEGERWRGPAVWFKNDGLALHFGVGYPF